MASISSLILALGFLAASADPTACEKAFFGMVSEDGCGNENGPDAAKACSSKCKPLGCAVVSSCTANATIQIAGEMGVETIPTDDLQSIVQELAAEHTSCPCSEVPLASQTNKTAIQQTMQAVADSLKKGLRDAQADPTACEKAFFGMVSEDGCGNENGPDASKACSSKCKPLGCAVVSSCTANSTVQIAGEMGVETIPTDDLQSIVQELAAEHTSCPCSEVPLASPVAAVAEKPSPSLRGKCIGCR